MINILFIMCSLSEAHRLDLRQIKDQHLNNLFVESHLDSIFILKIRVKVMSKGSREIAKLGVGYKHVLTILNNPLWFTASPLSIGRYLKTLSKPEKLEIISTLVSGHFFLKGQTVIAINKKLEISTRPLAGLDDEKLGAYILSIGYNQIHLILKAYVKFNVPSTKLKKTG